MATDDGIELALGGQLREVATELVEQLRRLLRLGGATTGGGGCATRLGATTRAGQHADDLVADLLGVGIEVEQDAGGNALVLADEAEQDVLGADVVVAERQGLAQRQLENLLGARGERDLARRHLFALADDARDVGAHVFHRDVEGVEHARGEPLLLAQQAEQDVLGADVVVLEGTRLVLRKDDDLTCTLCKSLEHVWPPAPCFAGLRRPDSTDHRLGAHTTRAWCVPIRSREPACGLRPDHTSLSVDQVRMAGNRTTSRMVSCPVSSIARRSMPRPTPPVGGRPYSSAVT